MPAAFWMNDPKINPRSDHLFWAALLTLDRQRIERSLAVIAAEITEKSKPGSPALQEVMAATVHHLIDQFFDQIEDDKVCRKLRERLLKIIPEWMNPEALMETG